MPAEPQQQEVEGKLAWGILFKLIAPSVFHVFASKDIILARVVPNAASGEPTEALVAVNADGKPVGFPTGERFKLRALFSFDAVVVQGNITPKGVLRQIYPATAGQAASKEVLLLGPKEYPQFIGDVGRDQITITVRDPRLLETGHTSQVHVFRKDETYGSNFVQKGKPGLYPMMAEAIGIQHYK